MTLKFPYKKFPAQPIPSHPDIKTILRPVLPIFLIYGDKSIGYEALIDSGADYCIFHTEIGELIGLNITSGKLMEFFGISGSKQRAYFHEIIIKVGGWEYPCYAGFSHEIKNLPYGILGQNGFFDLFTVSFDIEKEKVELKKK